MKRPHFDLIIVPEWEKHPDNIESNISSIAVDTSGAADELTTAHEYQRKAGRRAACLMIILVVVVAIVLLAVRSFAFTVPRAEI